ncbi:hypothetical protein [Mucilaginibacter lacusdianchii]|uniref:hypothetical protein n=1 Tax=Mucilaginibacter lacusdianchii TaxID=2684211 RepID=UPI00131C64BF|nr:hypothetical protein [Mucilaginibacter sp. JXJ CY 39]
MAAGLMLLNIAVLAQSKARNAKHAESAQFISFKRMADDAGIGFCIPDGFKEIKPVNNENFDADYAMALPGEDFEVWIQVRSLKQSWNSYEQLKDIRSRQLENPDSLYKATSRALALQLSFDNKYFSRNLQPDILEQYNADAGKTYLVNLSDSPETHRFKYAMLIALQKDHTGMVMALCLANEKGPELFKNINKARDCLRFK